MTVAPYFKDGAMKIIEFHVRDSNGNIVRYGTCSEDTLKQQANEGESVHLGKPSRIPEDPPLLGDNYINNRYKAYPSIADQLDLIYHQGIDAWKAKITEIKKKYPKVT